MSRRFDVWINPSRLLKDFQFRVFGAVRQKIGDLLNGEILFDDNRLIKGIVAYLFEAPSQLLPRKLQSPVPEIGAWNPES